MARVIAFGVTVYLARRLGAAGYGVIALAAATMLYFKYIADCGIDTLGIRDVAEDRARIPVVAPSLLSARLVVAVSLIGVLTAVGLAVLPQPEGAIIAAYSISLIAVAAGTGWVLLGIEKTGRVAWARIAGEATTALLALALVRDLGDLGRMPALQFAGDALTAFLLVWLLQRAGIRLPVALDWSLVLPVFRRSWPLVAHGLLGLVIFNSDFFFLRAFRTSAVVGQYAAAYTLISFILNLGVAYAFSLLPVMTRLGVDLPGQRRLYDTAMAQVFAATVPMALGAFLLADAIIGVVFGARYAASAVPLRILLWTLPVALFRNVAQVALIAHGRQDRVLRTAEWAAGVNLALNAAIIPILGMTGAALSTLVTESVRTGVSLWFARGVGMPLTSPRRFWRTIVAAGAMAGVVVSLRSGGVWLAMAGGATTYLVALLLLGGLKLRRGMLPELSV